MNDENWFDPYNEVKCEVVGKSWPGHSINENMMRRNGTSYEWVRQSTKSAGRKMWPFKKTFAD